MMAFDRNNLENASSPYLRQHAQNPVWWQEWTPETLAQARIEGKLILVSVGYSTCHWCHVMAREVFSDPEAAVYLNQNFVSIKVDREERPDIDQHLMSFLTAVQGQGGWPLNAVLTPEQHPIYAMTYVPLKPRSGMPGFVPLLQKLKEFYETDPSRFGPFNVPLIHAPSEPEHQLRSKLMEGFDPEHGGYGTTQKFPPFCTLLFKLSYAHASQDKELIGMCALTLDQMAERGLHDHLQGGFFRYCVDREWTLPHFEKMLYDQAMALWTYALAFRVLGKPAYKKTAEKVIRCLEETFASDGLFYAAHDADTDHREGSTYLWDLDELKALLLPEEYEQFLEVYPLSAGGNFEGRNHLLKKEGILLETIEEKLLAQRKKRKQPDVDKKLITSWNCLAGIALVHAYRFLGREEYLFKAERTAQTLLKRHFLENRLAHSSCEGTVRKEEFLQDVSSLLLFLTYLHEEKRNYSKEIGFFLNKMLGFKRGEVWVEGRQNDFKEILAENMDQPVPSSASMAELAALRAGLLEGRDDTFPAEFREPRWHDFYNLSVLVRKGFFHVLTTPRPMAWETLPALSIQVEGKEFKDCYRNACRATLPAATD